MTVRLLPRPCAPLAAVHVSVGPKAAFAGPGTKSEGAGSRELLGQGQWARIWELDPCLLWPHHYPFLGPS